MIKYLGSKRRLVPVLGEILDRSGATTALDLFCGTTRVAQEFKRRGAHVTAVDSASYARVFAECYIATDRGELAPDALAAAIADLNALPGRVGYVTQTFCEDARFFQPKNGARIDAIRTHLAAEWTDHPLYPVLLTSLIEAADRVDSTTGVQMAYLKGWAPRSHNDLELRVPELLAGAGRAIQADAVDVASDLGHFDLAYLDPPYNQHRYFTNYHVWETLVRWDHPEHYGVACKRLDCRDASTKSVFNAKREMPDALRGVIADLDCDLLVLSYNDESWIPLDDLMTACGTRGAVTALGFDSKRYVGAQIGIHGPSGKKVGEVSHLRNLEYLLIAGDAARVAHVTEPFDEQRALATPSTA